MAKRLQVILQDPEYTGDSAHGAGAAPVDCRLGAAGPGRGAPPRAIGGYRQETGCRPCRHKTDAQWLLEKLLSERIRLVTDAEVLQENMHRYAAIDRLDAIQPAFETRLGSR
jgi:hypothetical protein